MPHQRKYVPSHSGGTASQPSRAKRWMSAYASQGFSSRLSLSTRCAFVSFTASLMGASRNAKAGERARFSAVLPAFVFAFDVALRRSHVTRHTVGVPTPTLYIAGTWQSRGPSAGRPSGSRYG